MWIFSGHFCYYSYLFGNETKVRLRLSEISKITPSGNSSIEIITIKTNEQHKFVGFPSKERRDAVVQFVIQNQKQSKNKHKSPSHLRHSQNHHHNNSISEHPISSSSKISSRSRPHSHSLGDDSFFSSKSENDLSYKTSNINPYPKPPPPSKPAPTKPIPSPSSNITTSNGNNNNNDNHIEQKHNIITMGNGHHHHHNDIKHNDNTINIKNGQDVSTQIDKEKTKKNEKEEQPIIIKKKSHEKVALSPAKFIGLQSLQQPLLPSQQIKKQTQQTRRRKSSGGRMGGVNPPIFHLQSIHSQQSLHLVTPQACSSDDDENENKNKNEQIELVDHTKLKRQSSNSSSTMDTLDILNLDRPLSVNSSPDVSGRHRSLSDSDMHHHDDHHHKQTNGNNDKSDHSHHKKSKSKGNWFDNIFQFSPIYILFAMAITKNQKQRNKSFFGLTNSNNFSVFFCFIWSSNHATFSGSYFEPNGEYTFEKENISIKV